MKPTVKNLLIDIILLFLVTTIALVLSFAFTVTDMTPDLLLLFFQEKTVVLYNFLPLFLMTLFFYFALGKIRSSAAALFLLVALMAWCRHRSSTTATKILNSPTWPRREKAKNGGQSIQPCVAALFCSLRRLDGSYRRFSDLAEAPPPSSFLSPRGGAGELSGYLNRCRTPYILWANRALKEKMQKPFVGEGPDLSPQYLMNYTFRYLGWTGPKYMQIMEEKLPELTVVNDQVIKNEGRYLFSKDEEFDAVQQFVKSLDYYNNKHFYYFGH